VPHRIQDRLRAGDAERPLVCFSPLGGGLHAYQHLARALRPGLPVWVMEAPEVAGLEQTPDTVTALAELHVAELLPLLSVLGAVRLAGYSWGGMVAVEVARLLRARGVAVETVLILDGGAPDPDPDAAMDGERVELGFLARQHGMDLAAFAQLDLEEKIVRLAEVLRGTQEPANALTWEEHLRRIARALQANLRRSSGWQATSPGMPVRLVVAEESCRNQPDLGWGPVVGAQLQIVPMAGDHQSIVLPPLVHTLARHVEAALGPVHSPEAPLRLLPGRQHLYRSELTDSTRWEHFRPRSGDIFVCTMPKHGTTWMQTLVAMLLEGGPQLPWPLALRSPWFDSEEGPVEEVVARLEAQIGRRILKTHTPIDGVPYFPECTYLAVYRDPRDAFFSMAEHAENMKEAERARLRRLRDADADFQEWVAAPWPPGLLDAFALQETLHHLQAFDALRHLPNVHLFHYADLRRDLPTALDRLAAVLDVPLDPVTRAHIAAAADLGAMRGQAARYAPGTDQAWHEVERFFAQGRLGGWRGKLSESSLALFERRLEATLGPDLARWLLDGEPDWALQVQDRTARPPTPGQPG
jgi:thioesterase domain-containing protein